MANTLKKIMRKRKKRKYAAEKAKQAKEQGRQNGKEYGNDYNKKRSRHKRNAVKRTIITAVAVVAAIAAVGFYMEKRSYHNYKIVQSSEQEDVISTSVEAIAQICALNGITADQIIYPGEVIVLP